PTRRLDIDRARHRQNCSGAGWAAKPSPLCNFWRCRSGRRTRPAGTARRTWSYIRTRDDLHLRDVTLVRLTHDEVEAQLAEHGPGPRHLAELFHEEAAQRIVVAAFR